MTHTLILSLPAILFTRPLRSAADWSEAAHGPGRVELPEGLEYGFRIHNIDDGELEVLLDELSGLEPLTSANLSENRKITDDGLKLFQRLPNLTALNLSSCGLTNEGMPHLVPLSRLSALDISYCNRLTGLGLKALRPLKNLQTLNLQGCIKITNGDVARSRRPGLTIKK